MIVCSLKLIEQWLYVYELWLTDSYFLLSSTLTPKGVKENWRQYVKKKYICVENNHYKIKFEISTIIKPQGCSL
jgi:hypothetical protein